MNRIQRFNLLRRVAAPLVCGGLLGITAMNGGAAAPNPSNHSHDIGGSGQWSAVGEQKYADGTVKDTWRASNGAVITARGAPGLHVNVLPEVASRGSGQSIDHSVGIAITRTLSKNQSSTGAGQSSAMRMANSIYNYACYSYTSPDGHVYAYSCDTMYLDQTGGVNGWDWYLADLQKTSAKSDCATNYFCDHLRSVYQYESWISGNEIIQWTPGSTNSVGSCYNVTAGLNSVRTGLSYSVSQDICPNTFGPYVLNTTQFGGIWKGRQPDVNNYWEGSVSADEVHNPPYIDTTMTYRFYVSWCSWCF